MKRIFLGLFLAVLAVGQAAWAATAVEYAAQVTIHRDEWGVPHIYGETDAAVCFASAYSQCEDHFWQFEDTYIRSLGRYAEAVGEEGLQSDVENALFEIVSSSQRDYPQQPDFVKAMCEAYAAGYNYYLEQHPEVKPRLLTRMEPWHMMCFERFMMLGRLLGAAHASRKDLTAFAAEVQASIGSNQWAVGPGKTRRGSTMLFINPHQPWYGPGMFTEMHVKSDEGWDFSGCMFPGSPFPTAGFNDRLGWAYTVNEPDIADVYRVTFDKADEPLAYRYGDGYRQAEAWKTTLKVLTPQGLVERAFQFRKTHYGPVFKQEDATHFLAARVPKLYDGSRFVQSYRQTKARNFEEWHAAVSTLQLQTFNTMYADADGNIYYLYNGTIAKRDPSVDWTRPVDGSDPKNEWGDFHPIEELPQILNPASGYVQNCNSTPFMTTDDENPSLRDFPPYMVEDKYDDKRRAKMSRYLLRNAEKLTFKSWSGLAYDTTLYWPMTELPRYAKRFEALKATHAELAAQVQPFIEHLLDWDCVATVDSTQTMLAVQWYEQLYGRGYPVEDLKAEYVADIPARFQALVDAAKLIETTYGNWKMPYGEVHRIQRHANVAELALVPFVDTTPSVPIAGVPGPLGVAFTMYYTPPTEYPNRKLQYAVTGASYHAVIEFGKKVQAGSCLHYGQSHNPDSPHFSDQAKLLTEKKFKPAWYYWDDVLKHTVTAYRPGEEK